ITAHTVDSSSRRRRRRTDVKTSNRRRVKRSSRPQKQLTNIRSASAYVSSYQVRVVSLKISRRHHASLQNELSKTGSESLDLILYPRGHIESRTVRHVTVAPRHVSAFGCARRIKQRRLGYENKRSLGVLASFKRGFRLGNLVERTSNVNRSRSIALVRLPGNRTRQRPVQFERRRSISVPLQLEPVARGHDVSRYSNQLTRRQIA